MINDQNSKSILLCVFQVPGRSGDEPRPPRHGDPGAHEGGAVLPQPEAASLHPHSPQPEGHQGPTHAPHGIRVTHQVVDMVDT